MFKHLKEFDLDGGSLTGTIPEEITTCFPELVNATMTLSAQHRHDWSLVAALVSIEN